MNDMGTQEVLNKAREIMICHQTAYDKAEDALMIKFDDKIFERALEEYTELFDLALKIVKEGENEENSNN